MADTTGSHTAADPPLTSSPAEGAVSRADSFKSAASSLHSNASPENTGVSATPASSCQATIAGEREEAEWQPPKNGPLKTIIPRPVATAKPAAVARLTPEQETKYATVLAGVSQWTSLPSTSAKNAAQAPLQEHERMWLTRDCLLRYLRATKWNTAHALKRLQATLTWRREFGADGFTAEYISPENETGKQLLLGFDNQGRPCLYLNPAKQNTKVSDRQIHHLSYMLDRTVEMMPPGQESACLLINFKGAANGSIPSVNQARTVLNILQGHSPERLGKALISELPWYVHTFFKLISPFIDPVTKEKMKFNDDLKKYVPVQQLWNAHGGELDFEYDHEQYWPSLTEECKRRREAYRARWEKAGKHIGEYEAYLRGGDHSSLKELTERANIAIAESGEIDSELAAQIAKLNV